MRTVALSGDWIKLVDTGPTQLSTCQIAANAAGSTQKRRPGRRGRKPSAVVEVASDDCQDTSNDFTWWRGGTLSKLMFQRGVLPSSMIRKAARQGTVPKPSLSPLFFCREVQCCSAGCSVLFLYMLVSKSTSIFIDKLNA